MNALQADLEATADVLEFLSTRMNQIGEPKSSIDRKMKKAYSRLYERVQKVYIRTDNNHNKTVGNA